MNEKFFTLKEVDLNNNCPECYSREGLKLAFSQKFVENSFYKAITNQTIQKLNCNICDTEIFANRWTEDIEQVVAYQKRATPPKPKSFKLKKLSWYILFSVIIILVVIILFTTGIIGENL